MEEEKETTHLAALCKQLGGLCVAVDKNTYVDKVKECRLSLIGQLHKNPKINVQAFQKTMRKAWRLENVEISLIETGTLEFKFWCSSDRAKVLEQGPWSFANHLLLLKEWEPDTPLACYDFTTCDF